jgi:glycosyltransferase involved in cell wall biosynthesis
MRVAMFVYNRCTTDARVLREAKTLAGAGHDVKVVAVLDQETSAEERRDGFRIQRIDRNPIHYRLLKRMRLLTRFTRRRARRGAAYLSPRLSDLETGRASWLLAPLAVVRWAAKRLAATAFRALAGLEETARRMLLWPHKPLMFFDYYRRAYQLVKQDPPDALHAHDLNTLPVAAALAWRFRARLTYDAHELYPDISTLSKRESAVWRFIEARLAPRSTDVITVCESISDELERRYRLPPPVVLLNCPDSDGGTPLDRTLLRTHLGLPEDEPVILYQGGFSPYRGLPTIVRAAHHIERGTVVLMGWGRIEEDLRELIGREGLSSRVLLTGPVPSNEVVAYAAGATVGLIPYEPVGLNNTYTTPNKLFDYMAAGLPVAASRLPELVRFVEGEGMGLTFAPGDSTALAAAVNELLRDGDSYHAMRVRAEEASTRFTWSRESRKLIDLYGGSGEKAQPARHMTQSFGKK